MGDIWKFDMISNQWENIEVFGISSIKRELYLWNGTKIEVLIDSQDKLKDDLNNTFVLQSKDLQEG